MTQQSFQGTPNGNAPNLPAVQDKPKSNVVPITTKADTALTRRQRKRQERLKKTAPAPAATTPKATTPTGTKTYVSAVPVVCSSDMINIKEKHVTFDPLLAALLMRATPHGHEQLLYDTISKAIAPRKFVKDEKGNLVVVVEPPKKDDGTDAPASDTLFVSHMDTVHYKAEIIDLFIAHAEATREEPGYVRAAVFDEKLGRYKPEILGADDKLGVFILIRMIQANIPGTYLFCVGEEKGCIGSRWKVQKEPEFFKKFKKAVEFDRKDHGDIVFKQRGSETASREFAQALSDQLNKLTGDFYEEAKCPHTFKPDPTGVFTDTAVMDDLIPECINVSVGYFDQHSSNERFDYIWLLGVLIPVLKKVDWAALPVKRAIKPRFQQGTYGGYTPGTHAGSGITRLLPHLVDEHTPLGRLPQWGPLDGLWGDIPKKSMNRIMWGYYHTVYAGQMDELHRFHTYVHRMEAMILLMTHQIKQQALKDGTKEADTWSFLEDAQMQRLCLALAPHVGRLMAAIEVEKTLATKGTTKEPADKEGDRSTNQSPVTTTTTDTTKSGGTANTEAGSAAGYTDGSTFHGWSDHHGALHHDGPDRIATTDTAKYGIIDRDLKEAGWPDPDSFPGAYLPKTFNPKNYTDISEEEWVLAFATMQGAFDELTAAYEENANSYNIINSKHAELLKPYLADWNFLCSVIVNNGAEIGALEFASAASIMTNFIHELADFAVHEDSVQKAVKNCFKVIDENPLLPIFDEFDCDSYLTAFTR